MTGTVTSTAIVSDRIASTIDEHLGLAHAVLDGAITEAERLFIAHLDDSQAVVERRVSAAITRMATAPEMEDDQ